MKQMMKYTFAIVTMLLVSLGAKANGKVTVNGTDVIDEQGNSATYTSPQGQGTVAASIDNSRNTDHYTSRWLLRIEGRHHSY